jgi:hypothetical protein
VHSDGEPREPFGVARVPVAVIRCAWPLVIRWGSGLGLGTLLGCAAIPAEDELVVPETRDAPRMVTGLADEPLAPLAGRSVDEPSPGPTCTWDHVEPQRFAAFVSPPESAECRPRPSRKRRAELGRIVREQWMWSWPDHAKLSLEHGCDRLGELSTVVFDASSGHGGSLEVVRLDRRADGDWDVLWIDYNGYMGGPPRVEGDPWQEEAPGASRLRRGVLSGERVDPMLRRVREALALEVRELEPPPEPDSFFGQSYGFSTRDFHVGLRLVDARGRGTEHYFGGYESGDEQQGRRIALDLAAEEVWTVLGDDALVAGLDELAPRNPAVRELFAGAFWAARARTPEYGLWYVRERLFGLAWSLGGPEHVPALLNAVRPKAAGEEEDASEERSRVSAINVLAELTGFDTRYDAAGKPRKLETVAAEVLAACDGG